MSSHPGTYLFGDTDRAARRLSLLHQLFKDSSEGFSRDVIGRVAEPLGGCVVDLGCGIGCTTDRR